MIAAIHTTLYSLKENDATHEEVKRKRGIENDSDVVTRCEQNDDLMKRARSENCAAV